MKRSRIQECFGNEIAVIGMDCLLPGAKGVSEFWDNLVYGVDCTRSFPKKRQKDMNAYYDYVGISQKEFKAGGYLNDIDKFDYQFFHITPKEAALMNPNQRLLLQTVYRTFQDAGLKKEDITGSDTGLYIGYIGDYEGNLYNQMVRDLEIEPSATGGLSSIMAGRISFLLDLHGPAMLVDTACSSSLTAIHMACNALRNGECTMAIAGGVRTILFPDNEYEIGIESHDGITRAFDEKADGTGIGEGCGAVLLKPLQEAIKDKDMIYAVIRGSALNQDGNCMGLTAPNVKAQIEVLKSAWQAAGICPEELSYIETHGTGTKLGDPIEINGLNKAFSCFTDNEKFCAIGSVKSNIGHLYDCAGIIGLIKTVLMLYNKVLVPTIHFDKLNPDIHMEHSPLYINTQTKEWDKHCGKRLAGVSAFGFSGTNCHVVLEGYEDETEKLLYAEEKEYIFQISAASKSALGKLINEYRIFICKIQHDMLGKMCNALNIQQDRYDYLLYLKIHSIEQLQERLEYIYGFRLFEEDEYQENGIYIGKFENKYVSEDITYGAKMRLPLYPFDENRCWIRIPEGRRKMVSFSEPKGNQMQIHETTDVVLNGRTGNYSHMEQQIGNIFGLEMGFTSLNVTDSFYNLGGDSILAYKIINRINQQYGTAITIADIFAYNTIEMLAQFVDVKLLDERNTTRTYNIPIAKEQEYYPLSYAQQRMYVLYLRNPRDTSYNMPFVIRFFGELDVERFDQAFYQLVKLHDVFRTKFFLKDGEPVQMFDKDKCLEIKQFILHEADKEAELKKYFSFCKTPFDLERDMLIRVFLFIIKEKEEYVALIDMNHIIADGSSLGILLQDFAKLYQGQRVEKQSVGYMDFAVWQRNMNLQKQEEFWLEELHDYLQKELPYDIPRANSVHSETREQMFKIDEHVLSGLQKICRDMQISMFVLLLALYQIILSGYMGEDEVIVGSPITGRTAVETQNMVGMFVNVLPIRINIERQQSFLEFLNKLNEKIVKILEYQDYPFDLLVEKLKIKRDPLRNPVYDTVFALQNMEIPEISMDDLKIKLSNEDHVTKFDMTMEVRAENSVLNVTMKYNSGLFYEETIGVLMNNYRSSIEKILNDPNIMVDDLKGRPVRTALEDAVFDEFEFDF